jgi:hypothetical protein
MRRLLYFLHTTPFGFVLEILVATVVAAAMGTSAPILVVFGLLVVPSFVVGDNILLAIAGRLPLGYTLIDVLGSGLAVVGWTLWRTELSAASAAGALLYCALMREGRALVGVTTRSSRGRVARGRRRRGPTGRDYVRLALRDQ